MKTLLLSVLLVANMQFSTADLCSYNFTLADLPNSLILEVINLIAGNIINEISNCSLIGYASKDIEFWLYTRSGPSDGLKMSSLDTAMLKGRKTIVLTHGFLCSRKNNLMPELKDAYLKRYDANVIIIDWSAYSKDYYANVHCNVPRIAQTFAEFLCKADSEQNIDIEDVHVVGHSMGGQMAGFIGKQTQAQCSKVLGRISGLDPAGPLYFLKPRSRRLTNTDAKEVMVIHTNKGVLGYDGNCGTADYYPNSGASQAGCTISNSPATDFIGMVTYPTACNHLRAVDYMIESIGTNNFVGESCFLCTSCLSNPFFGSKGVMGEDFTYEEESCSYYMPTNSQSPYGKGP
ncbi:phospholipase A1-like [Photinus pyralis]|nr:phospholipase A1-like [Photinus pyralis]